MKPIFKTIVFLTLSLVLTCSCGSDNEDEPIVPTSPQTEQVSMNTLKNRKWTISKDGLTKVYNFLTENKVVVTEMLSEGPMSISNTSTRSAGPQTYDGTYTFNSSAKSAYVSYNGKTQKFENIVLTTDVNASVSCTIDGESVVLSAAIGGIEDKTFIENAAMQFVQLFNSKQSERYASISKALERSEVSSGLDRELDGIIDGLTSITKDGLNTYYMYAIKASLFKGQYILENGKWIKKNAEGHSATFYDNDGRLCQLVVTTSGQKKNVIVYEKKDYIGVVNWDNYPYYTWDEYLNTYTYNVEIPSHIAVVLTQGSNQLVNISLNIDLSNVEDNQKINLSKNSLAMTCVADFAEIANITTINSYKAQGESSSQIIIKKNDQIIFSATALAESNFYTQSPEDLNHNDVETLRNVKFSIDVLGKIQLKGSCSRVDKLMDALDNADDWENKENYSYVKFYVDEANKFFTANVYYNNGSNVRAWAKFDVTNDDYLSWIPKFDKNGNYIGYDYKTITEYMPAIAIGFNDGTSYLMENYFTAKAFKQVVDYVSNEAEKIEKQF